MSLLLALSGCAHVPATPHFGAVSHVVYAVSHGRHTGLVIERSALVAALPALVEVRGDAGDEWRYLELGWGDERFYRSPDPGAWDGLRAIAWPTLSTLHVVGFDTDPRQRFARAELIALGLTRQQHDRLLRHVAAAFVRDSAGMPVSLGAHHAGHGHFYRATGRFHLFRTCNTWLAGAFEAAGLPVNDRLVVTSDGVFGQLRPLAVEHPPRPLR